MFPGDPRRKPSFVCPLPRCSTFRSVLPFPPERSSPDRPSITDTGISLSDAGVSSCAARSTCARVVSAVLAVALSAVPVFAQGQPAPSVRRLSMDEAVRLALEQNLGLQVERMNPQIQDIAVAQAQSSWVPNVSSSLTNNSTNSPSTSLFSGGQDRITDASRRGRARPHPEAADWSELLGGLGQLARDLDEHLQHVSTRCCARTSRSAPYSRSFGTSRSTRPVSSSKRAGRIARRRICSFGRRSS